MTTAARRRKPAKRTAPVETAAGRDSYAAFMARAVRAYVRRAEAGDDDALLALVQLRAQVDDAIHQAGRAMHANGFSWAEIAAPLGVTRQAAAMRFGGAK